MRTAFAAAALVFAASTAGAEPPPASFFGELPAKLSMTHVFTDLVKLTPAKGMLAYDVNVPLWSDGARKQRWLKLPRSGRVEFDATGPWKFPVGTTLVKQFDLETAPGKLTRVETRFLVLERHGWVGYTYAWDDDQRDATLTSQPREHVYQVHDAAGGVHEQRWKFPSRGDCLRCHGAAAGGTLGVRTWQIHRDGQLARWNAAGVFTRDIGDESRYEAYPANPASDASAPLERRARAYLAVNCAQCHFPSGPVPIGMDFRYDAVDLGAIGVRPISGDLGAPDPFRIKPGDHASSLVWLRMTSLDPNWRMPPIASQLVDEDGAELIRAWIDSL